MFGRLSRITPNGALYGVGTGLAAIDKKLLLLLLYSG
jgi:hypothetical protein